jgi:hypothetical protein
MNNNINKKLPTSFWIVVAAAVVWSLFGVMAYFTEVTMSEEVKAALPDAQQALYAAQPAWVTGAFAIAVFAGLIGSLLLAVRKCAATAVFVVSLIAVVAQMSYAFFFSDMLAVMGPSSAILPVAIIIIGAALIGYSAGATRKGWIN